jgi:hypothetical protein
MGRAVAERPGLALICFNTLINNYTTILLYHYIILLYLDTPLPRTQALLAEARCSSDGLLPGGGPPSANCTV